MQWTKRHILENCRREKLVVRALEDESHHGADGRQIVTCEALTRNLNVARQDLSAGLNWRPGINWQLQMDLARGLERDRKSEDPLAVSYWEFKPRLSYAARGKARATADLTYLQVNADENPGNRAIPYEMGRGKKAGSSWLWNGRFEYFINTNVTINVNYTGRRDAGALRTIHLGKAEVRAFF